MKKLGCVVLLALAPAFAQAETSWGLVDAVYGHSSATSSGFPANAVKSMWPFHSDETYIAGSASTASRTVAEEYTGNTIARGANDWAPERVYACGRYIGKSGQDANTYVQEPYYIGVFEVTQR